MQDEQWGPWIEHDGKGCPCRGAFCHITFQRPVRSLNPSALRWGAQVGPSEWVGVTNPTDGDGSWDWSSNYNPVIRYRIRKPRALLDLIERARELDNAPEGPRVTRKVPA